MTDDLDQELRAALTRTSDDARFAAALAVVQQALHAQMGTLHRLGADEHLHLVAASPGIPEPVLAASRRIPLGKGIAGEAAATAKPVSLCNLQTDASGVARPGAKATGLGGRSVCRSSQASGSSEPSVWAGWASARSPSRRRRRSLVPGACSHRHWQPQTTEDLANVSTTANRDEMSTGAPTRVVPRPYRTPPGKQTCFFGCREAASSNARYVTQPTQKARQKTPSSNVDQREGDRIGVWPSLDELRLADAGDVLDLRPRPVAEAIADCLPGLG